MPFGQRKYSFFLKMVKSHSGRNKVEKYFYAEIFMNFSLISDVLKWYQKIVDIKKWKHGKKDLSYIGQCLLSQKNHLIHRNIYIYLHCFLKLML